MSLGKNLLKKTGSSGGGPNNGLPVGNKPIKSITSTGIPTKTDVLAGQKEAYPGMKFGPNQVNVAKNTISSQGAKPGSQVTTTKNVKVTEGATGGKQTTDQNAYMSGLAKRFPGASGEELAKKIPGSKGSYISSSMIDKYNKSYYTPKTETTGTPGSEAVVSAPIELDNEAEKQTTGENTVETKTTPDDKTTKDNKLGNLPIGSANITKGGTGRKASNPINPVSLASDASTSKDFNLKLNNQAVNKA